MRNNELILLYDYKGHFGSKYNAVPYRSGMSINLLKKYFYKNGYKIQLLSFSDIDFQTTDYRNKIIIYTSQEDSNYLYKSYIEDIILGLEYAGAKVIPPFKYLRANNNKVFMEILRQQLQLKKINNVDSKHFGTYEEILNKDSLLHFPLVLKSAGGAMSSGVYLANNKNQLLKYIRRISKSKDLKKELWDIFRQIKHKGYVRESKYRKKFIVQELIKNLENDWKVLIFGNKYYVLKRLNRKDDFRASGSGRLLYEKELPEGLLNFSEICFNTLKIPSVSLDIAFNGKDFFLLEFQVLYFGTYTLEHSEFYFSRVNREWSLLNERSILEESYVESITEFIKKSESSIYK